MSSPATPTFAERRVKERKTAWLVAIAEQTLDAATDSLDMAREETPNDVAIADCYRAVLAANAMVFDLRKQRGWSA